MLLVDWIYDAPNKKCVYLFNTKVSTLILLAALQVLLVGSKGSSIHVMELPEKMGDQGSYIKPPQVRVLKTLSRLKCCYLVHSVTDVHAVGFTANMLYEHYC